MDNKIHFYSPGATDYISPASLWAIARVSVDTGQQIRQLFQLQGGVMARLWRGNRIRQVTGGITGNKTLSHGVTHNGGDTLLHPHGGFLIAFFLKSQQRHQQISGFELSHGRFTEQGERMNFHRPGGAVSVGLRPAFFGFDPHTGNLFETGVCFVTGFALFLNGAGVGACSE